MGRWWSGWLVVALATLAGCGGGDAAEDEATPLRVYLTANFDRRSAVMRDTRFDPADPVSYSVATSTTVRWRKETRALTLYLRHVDDAATSAWEIRAAVDGRITASTVTVRFGAFGTLDAESPATLCIASDETGLNRAIAVDFSGVRALESNFRVSEFTLADDREHTASGSQACA